MSAEATPTPNDPAIDASDESVGEGGAGPRRPDGFEQSTSVEDLLELTEVVTAERDQYLEMLQRSQAEFENYKKRVAGQQSDMVARAAEALVEQLLPVLDAFDGAISHDATGVEPLYNALLDALTTRGLERIDNVAESFDPNQHDAVMYEPGEGGDDQPTVVEVMRPGYRWNSRVLRPAMVKVRG